MHAIKEGFFSRSYRLVDDENQIGELRTSWFKDDAEALVNGSSFKLYREGTFSGAFLLEKDQNVIAHAVKPSMWQSTFEITFGHTTCTLKKTGFFRRGFALEHEGQVVGRLTREGWSDRKANVLLPDNWPEALQVFVLWLALIIWHREAAAASAGG